ncbi:hypothetical protein [Latilactobacillus graminis]|uniref:Membrane protein n=2 Tax=Latilactobacillus graminis TaxID=60519 RepID=A0AA89KZV5_9LACO|nr:hypothetical protein [Latilactobacillus graminis]KRM21041.1 membrane protein [Latilactobacillus graminis DSM 20719]QFP79175.1 hypothetical protein LG542_02555 [Latilactobacillus graminis]
MTNLFNLPQMLQSMLLNCLLVIALPLAFAGVLTLINRSTKRRLAHWWDYSQLLIGGLGTVIHEISHAVACLIFQHQIVDMQLLKLNLRDNPDHSLGHVNHRYRPGRLWPTIGNLWIGIAPIFGCSAAIFGLTWLLARPTFKTWLNFAEQPSWQLSAIGPLFKQLGTTQLGPLLLWLILTSMITIGGFDLSTADFKGTIPGIIATIITVCLITGLFSFVPTVDTTTWLIGVLTPMAIILTIAVSLSSIYWLLITGIFALLERTTYHARH